MVTITTKSIYSVIIGIEMKFKDISYPIIISPSEIPDLNTVKYTDKGIEIGACISLTKLNKILSDAIEKLPGYLTLKYFSVLIHAINVNHDKRICPNDRI